jgi:4-hydroxy-tetrahydrodipicolinate synthase
MQKQFKGVYTAIVTPFKKDGSIDWKSLEKIVELQIQANVAGIVPCGTTGESPTLTEEEQVLVIKRVVELTNRRCQVIAGTGSNSTSHAVHLSKAAEKVGVDGCLVVNPYYNKPTQEGLYRHFKAVADSVNIPIVAYNIKGRTGVNLETDTLLRLISTCPNIIADKEASGDLVQIEEVIKKTPVDFCTLSGDDNLTLPILEMGGDGVISVASNFIPEKIVTLVELALAKKSEEAKQLHNSLMPLFEAIFIETNPIPIKAALAMHGICEENYRLPICELRPENRKRFESVLSELGLVPK